MQKVASSGCLLQLTDLHLMCLCVSSCPVRPFRLTDVCCVLWNTGDILKAGTDCTHIPYQRDCVTRHQDACVPGGGLLEWSEPQPLINRELPLLGAVTGPHRWPYGSSTSSVCLKPWVSFCFMFICWLLSPSTHPNLICTGETEGA